MPADKVLILTGEFKGHEGVILGRSADCKTFDISPDGSDAILTLKRPQFGLLVTKKVAK